MIHWVAAHRVVLTSNGGLSNIKFVVYELGEAGSVPQRGLAGQLNRIGQPEARLTTRDPATGQPVVAADQPGAIRFLLDWLAKQLACQGPSHAADVGGASYWLQAS